MCDIYLVKFFLPVLSHAMYLLAVHSFFNITSVIEMVLMYVFI